MTKDEESYACTQLQRQLDVEAVLGRNLLDPNAREVNYRVELNIDNPTADEIKSMKVEIYEKDSTGTVTLKEAELKEDLTIKHTLQEKQKDEATIVEVRAKVYTAEYPDNTGEGVSYLRVVVDEEVSDVSIDSKEKTYTPTAKTDDDLTVYAKTNAPEGEALPIKLEIFMKGSEETKIVELEEYVENTEINRTLTLEEIAQLGSVDVNDIKETQATIIYKDKEYKSNKTKAKRTLVAKGWTDNGTLNDIVEGKKKESYKKGAKGEEVKLIQTALQKMKINIGEDGVDGVFGNDGENAVKTFQANFKPTHKTHQYTWSEPDGIVGKNTLLAMDEAFVAGWKYVEPEVVKAPWIKTAETQLGVSEFAGKHKENPQIREYYKAGKYLWATDDSGAINAWCGCFVAWVMQKEGYTPVKNAFRAKSWMSFGKKINKPVHGAIGIKNRKGGGHTAFIVGKSKDGKYFYMLGGGISQTKLK